MTNFFMTVLGLICFTSFANPAFDGNSNNNDKPKPKEKITTLVKWIMPDSLNEISGICWVDEQRLACVQDELGIIFIYNILSAKIENQIPFANHGDFESVTKADDTYYVMRSDGQIFEINTSSKNLSVKQYNIPLDETNDVEGIFYDGTKKRLLIAIKRADPQTPAKIKGIYSFDLSTKIMSNNPVYEIDLSNPLIYKEDDDDDDKNDNKEKEEKKLNETFLPSDIAIHPKTSDIYITDGIHRSLLILDKTGKIKSHIKLDKDDFPQPEGITFSSEGDMFISSEGVKQNGVIAKVTIETNTKKDKKD